MSARVVVVFLAGLLFALGLGLAGMTQPAKVTGFLDFTGAWDPSLGFVMVGAIGVYAAAWRLSLGREAPWLAPSFSRPDKFAMDRRLVIGAAVFGVGWGLSGFCPGPAVVSLASATLTPVIFVAAVLAGMALHDTVEAGRKGP